MNIYEALSKIQNELKCPKSQYNSFGKYNYRNAEDILEAAKPVCVKYGTALIVTDEIVLIGERYYVRATATLVSANGDKHDIVISSAYAREDADKKGMDGSQITGSASSYARKYALNGLFAIDDTKDADSQNNGQAAKDKPKSKPAEPAKTAQNANDASTEGNAEEEGAFPPESYKCSVCGKGITEKLFKQTLNKYGTPLCSAECKDHLVKTGELLS